MELESQLHDRMDALLEGSVGRPLVERGSIDCFIDLTEQDEDDPVHHETRTADGAGA